MSFKPSSTVLVVIFILFLCTGFILLDVDKIVGNKQDEAKFTTSVSGIINVEKYLHSGNAYREIVEHNIFTSQPSPDIEIVRTKAPLKTDVDIVLNGIIVSPESRIVLLTDMQEKTSHFLVEGETLKEWTLDKIENKSVIFTNKSGKQLVLMINEDNLD